MRAEKMIMNPKVQEFLQAKQAKEAAKQAEAKQELLAWLEIYDKVVVEKKEDSDEKVYDDEEKKYIYYKYQYPEITDEEYRLLLKYGIGESSEDNGEKGLIVVARIMLICSICCCLILFAFDWIAALYGVGLVVSALISYWVFKVFANISRKSTAIYNLLEGRENQ